MWRANVTASVTVNRRSNNDSSSSIDQSINQSINQSPNERLIGNNCAIGTVAHPSHPGSFRFVTGGVRGGGAQKIWRTCTTDVRRLRLVTTSSSSQILGSREHGRPPPSCPTDAKRHENASSCRASGSDPLPAPTAKTDNQGGWLVPNEQAENEYHFATGNRPRRVLEKKNTRGRTKAVY